MPDYNLSSAAQAVLTAATQKVYCLDPEDVPISASEYGSVIAAALRAAVDQVVPEQAEPVGDSHDEARHDQWMRIRYKLLAIAEELEAQ